MFSKYSAIDVVFLYMGERLCGLFLFTLLAKHPCSIITPDLQEARADSPGSGQPRISILMQMLPLSNQDCGFMRM